MIKRGKRGQILLKNNRGYNEDIHHNHGKTWTVEEIKTIATDETHTLTELGELLGRSPHSICAKRIAIKKGAYDFILK